MASNLLRASSSLNSPAATCFRNSPPISRSFCSMSDFMRSSSSEPCRSARRRSFICRSSASRWLDHIRFSAASYFALASSSVKSPAATCCRRSLPIARSLFSMFAPSFSRSRFGSPSRASFMRSTRLCICSAVISPSMTITIIRSMAASYSAREILDESSPFRLDSDRFDSAAR